MEPPPPSLQEEGLKGCLREAECKGRGGEGADDCRGPWVCKALPKKEGGEEVLLLPMLLRLQAVPFEGEGEEDLEDGERTKSWGERSWRSVLTRGFFLATCVIDIGVREVGFLPFLSLGSLSLFPLLPYNTFPQTAFSPNYAKKHALLPLFFSGLVLVP